MYAAQSGPGDSPQRLGGSDDRDPLIGLQIEQVRIAGNDQVGLCGQRAREYMIVLGVGKYVGARLILTSCAR